MTGRLLRRCTQGNYHDEPTERPADRAADLTERERAARIADILSQPALRETGRCLNCREKLPAGQFCDSDCAEDWHKAQLFNGR